MCLNQDLAKPMVEYDVKWLQYVLSLILVAHLFVPDINAEHKHSMYEGNNSTFI